MKHDIVHKQEDSARCLVCGRENGCGVKASFFELDNGEVVAIFTPQEHHQSYPGRLHGGMAAAILDETIGRAMMAREKGTWSVTAELTIRYLEPVPLNEELRAVGRVTKDSRRLFEGTGEIVLKDGKVAVTASGKYMKMAVGRIGNVDLLQWRVTPASNDPKEIDL
jgi:uncharacterized protein (TIGR00369 family)